VQALAELSARIAVLEREISVLAPCWKHSARRA